MSPAEALIVSYGLPNYAIRIRPYLHVGLATLKRWPTMTTLLTKSGLCTLSAWRRRFAALEKTPALARSRWLTALV